MADRSFMFTADSGSGPWASGLEHNPDINRLAEARLRKAGVPIDGSNVARRYPWMRRVRETLTIGQQVRIVRAQWGATMVNQTPKPILVDEVRFALYELPDSSPSPIQNAVLDPVERAGVDQIIWVKMSIAGRKNIIERWCPMHMLNTDPRFEVVCEVDRFGFELPYPYYLKRGQTFIMDILQNDALNSTGARSADLTAATMVLNGYGANDREPIQQVKKIPTIAAASVDNSSWIVLPFDEDRDVPMRDAVITSIGLGAGLTSNDTGWDLQQLMFRPKAPEGPKWHGDEFYNMALLGNQVAQMENNSPTTNNVRHRPITPYVLMPGEPFNIELWNRSNSTGGNTGKTYYVDVAIKGTQEG